MIRQLFHFLGGVHFAVTLIGVTALFVIAGTVIESKTESHLYAAFYTYRHPAFITLLGFFFINILFAALRRWPFKPRHIPFLLTHLGLLMIISGTIIKQIHGVQGAMNIMEGSGSHEIALNETHAIRIEKRNPQNPGQNLLGDYDLTKNHSPFSDLDIELIGYAPHAKQQWETWIKGIELHILGLKPMPVFTWTGPPQPIPLSARVRLFSEPHEPFNIFALYTRDLAITAEKLYTYAIEAKKIPCLSFIKDLQGHIYVLAIDEEGKIWEQFYNSEKPDTLIVYDEGFHGYGVFANIQFSPGKEITLETPITLKHTNLLPLKKMEDNLARATLKLKKGEKEEILSLSYDRHGGGLQWPALEGEYLLRYQSKFLEIPFHIRLRQARQINYPGTHQPYSFESDLIITDRRDGSTTENTISMNQVHETPDGYRFYLSNITPDDESAVKRIQLIINYDPAKYYLTYPGGLILTLGILLLFWLHKWTQKRII